jgi:hypothetical protein
MKNKKWKTKCNGKVVKHGQKGAKISKVGSKKWKSYCARSKGISKKYGLDCSGKDRCSKNCLSRKKWKC